MMNFIKKKSLEVYLLHFDEKIIRWAYFVNFTLRVRYIWPYTFRKFTAYINVKDKNRIDLFIIFCCHKACVMKKKSVMKPYAYISSFCYCVHILNLSRNFLISFHVLTLECEEVLAPVEHQNMEIRFTHKTIKSTIELHLSERPLSGSAWPFG
jgi:hypothetical protein